MGLGPGLRRLPERVRLTDGLDRTPSLAQDISGLKHRKRSFIWKRTLHDACRCLSQAQRLPKKAEVGVMKERVLKLKHKVIQCAQDTTIDRLGESGLLHVRELTVNKLLRSTYDGEYFSHRVGDSFGEGVDVLGRHNDRKHRALRNCQNQMGRTCHQYGRVPIAEHCG